MYLGKIIGTIWSTRKYETLRGSKLLLLQPVNADYENAGEPIIAVDTIGAGKGEYVIYVDDVEAVIPLKADHAPVDASIVGIVDSVYKKNNY